MNYSPKISEYRQGNLGWILRLSGNDNGTLGNVYGSGLFEAISAKIFAVEDDAETLLVEAKFTKAIQIPGGVFDANGIALRSWSDVRSELLKNLDVRARAQARALINEAIRKLETIEIDWSSGEFLGISNASLHGEAKIRLPEIPQLDQPLGALEIFAELSLHATFEAQMGGARLQRSYALALRLRESADVGFGFSLADLNLALPECPVPLADLAVLDLKSLFRRPIRAASAAGEEIAGMLGILGRHLQPALGDLSVAYAWTPANPELVLKWTGDKLLFAIAAPGFVDADFDAPGAALRPKLAKFDATIASTTAGRVTIAVTNGLVGRGSTAQIFEASIEGKFDQATEIAPGTRNLGPLRVSWEKFTTTLEAGAIVTPAGTQEPDKATLRLGLAGRITLALADDPATSLTLEIGIELTPSGHRLTELKIVEPFPFNLLAQGASLLQRGGQQLLKILGQLKPTTDIELERLREILRILGKLAQAVAASAVFVADALATAVKTGADLVAKAVAGIAELLSQLLKSLANLLPEPGAPSLPAIDIEIRLGINPLQIRQLAVTFTGLPANSRTLDAGGLRLELQGIWRPMLLLDFVNEPGAYLMAIQEGPPTKEFATLSTDLWLKSDANRESVRDADKDTGSRPDKPILSVILEDLRPPGEPRFEAVVLAGMQRGAPVFFKRATSPVVKTVANGVATIDGAFALSDFDKNKFGYKVEFAPDRVLPFFGMGESGDKGPAAGDDSTFLGRLQKGLGQVVTVKKVGNAELNERVFTIPLILEVKAAGLKTEVTLALKLDLSTLEVSLAIPSGTLPLTSRRIEEKALGLTWIVEQKNTKEKPKALENNDEVDMFMATFANGESGFALNKDKARMEIRFSELSSDGTGVVLKVEEFKVGRSGLDLKATVVNRPVKINGLDVPFHFTTGGFIIRSGKLVEASLGGHGQLPPALVGDANCSILLNFGQGQGGVVLKSGKVELDRKGDPIVCHSTRFTLTITDLDLDFVRDGGYHFHFLVTGSLRFTPKPGEFTDGLLKHLGEVEMALERTPLAADPRVLARHVSFQKALNPKKDITLFNIFRLELRSFGFHPASPKFEGQPPAVNIAGQLDFGLGDVMQPKIDFHGLWLAPPATGESLPRIKADGLGIELNMAGSVKVRGSVLAVDPDTRTVEGARYAPDGYKTYGFLGEGALEMPGWGSMQASLGFLEVERTDVPGTRKNAFFLYLQKDKLSVQIPTPFWVFYLREAGFGFGYRFTLPGISEAEKAGSVAELIKTLDGVSQREGDLARYSSWKPDAAKNNFTLAMRAVIQMAPAEKEYRAETEKVTKNPFIFELVAALRSDLTFLMTARGWLGLNYYNFRDNEGDLRSRPGLRGFLYISVSRSELLLRAIGDSKGFIGEDFDLFKKGSTLRTAVESVDWSATLYIRPGMFHYELGWPDQLVARLIDKPNMRAVVRGGMIFRAVEEGVLLGYNIAAEANLRFEGRAGSSLGVAVVGELEAKFLARVIAYLARNFADSLLYGLISLDLRLRFSVHAWMEVDLGFTSFTIRIGFSFGLQFSAAVEIAVSPSGVGAQVAARIGVQAFGCTLSVGIGFVVDGNRLNEARARVARFLAMSLTAEQPEGAPVLPTQADDTRLDEDAGRQQDLADARKVTLVEPANPDGTKPPNDRATGGRELCPTDFQVVLRRTEAVLDGINRNPGSEYGFALLLPREAMDASHGGFYAAAPQETAGDPNVRPKFAKAHTVTQIDSSGIHGLGWIPDPVSHEFTYGHQEVKGGAWEANVQWGARIPVGGAPADLFTLAHLFDECYRTKTEWFGKPPAQQRRSTLVKEPQLIRIHEEADPPKAGSPRERELERDRVQRDHAVESAQHPIDDHVFRARSTALTMFLDQFVTFCVDGRRPAGNEVHVTDLGLIFYGPLDELAKLKGARVAKHDGSPNQGNVTVFNPREFWFDRADPVLASVRQAIEADGVKLDWQLKMAFEKPAGAAAPFVPEHFLHHYEITRTIEGDEFQPKTVRIKAAATIGRRNPRATNPDVVKLLAPEWQFVDAFDGEMAVPEKFRRALLPAGNETDALAAAIAWLEAFPDRDEVTFTYTVTPIDISGQRALPRAFVVDFRRPAAPVRPATGEVRIVQTMTADVQPKRDGEPPDDLKVYLALDDPGWDRTKPPKGLPAWADRTKDVAERRYAIGRIYRLVMDPDEIQPAGNYGSDGATRRARGPGIFAPPRTADERFVDVPELFMVDVAADPEADDLIREVEPDDKTRERLRRWSWISDKKFDLKSAPPPILARKPKEPLIPPAGEAMKTTEQLKRMLWTGVSDHDRRARVATRFSLETVVRIQELTENSARTFEIVSRRVSVPVEHVLVVPPSTDASKADDRRACLRPEAFEWVVPLLFPPLIRGQVAAVAGLARFKVPGQAARLTGLKAATRDVEYLPDVERRAMTQVRFAAGPSWTKWNPVHASAISRYELFELDLDELAPSDAGKDPTLNAVAWGGARRIAAIEQLTNVDAALVPDGNRDLIGWAAHYPSETRRRTAPVNSGDSPPLRSAWYSARETTAHFPERLPRLRFFPQVPEEAITALFAEGQPSVLVATLRAPAKATSARVLCVPPQCAAEKFYENWVHAEPNANDASTRFRLETPGRMTTADIRLLLFGLGWGKTWPSGLEEHLIKAWRDNPAAFDGLEVQIKGLDKTEKLTGSITLPVNLRSPIHPVLEELLGELAYRLTIPAAPPAVLSRAHSVMLQPPPEVGARQLAEFVAKTPPATDPYGWGVLQALGLAACIRVYAPMRDTFLSGNELFEHVRLTFERVLERWKRAVEDFPSASFAALAGQPFVEVHFKPGYDRSVAPADALIKRQNNGAEKPSIEHGDFLAFVQVSLRPRPVAVWTYWRIRLKSPPGDPQGGRIRRLAIQPSMKPDSVGTVWVAREAGGATVKVSAPTKEQPGSSGAEIPLPSADSAEFDGRERPEWTLLVRAPVEAESVVTDKLVLHLVIERERIEADGKIIRTIEKSGPISETSTIVALAETLPQTVAEPAWSDGSSGGPPDAFARFGEVSGMEWAAAFDAKWENPQAPLQVQEPAPKALDALVAALRAAVPRDDETKPWITREQIASVSTPYLEWVQRFLDHGAPRALPKEGGGMTNEALATPFLALASPVTATPWKLAPEADGFLTVSFLHGDRWGRTRAFAVRPVSRYQMILAGLGVEKQKEGACYEEDQVEAEGVGHAIASTPRTEKLATPVILGTSRRFSDEVPKEGDMPTENDVLEVIFATHGEENLAVSNRMVSGRLGCPASLISFARSYRFPNWPEEFNKLVATFKPDSPEVLLLPDRPAAEVVRPVAGKYPFRQITGPVVGALAVQYPSLWKGAEIWRVEPIPPHYRVLALAGESGGMVEADPMAIVHDDLPRRALAGQTTLLPPEKVRIAFQRIDGVIRLALTHPLVSHHDLTPPSASGWNGHGKADDVCWWPDPDVAYLLYRDIVEDGKRLFREEDAEIRLAAEPVKNDPTATEGPILVRTRGIRWDAVKPKPAVATATTVDDTRSFELTTYYQPSALTRQLRQVVTLVAGSDMPDQTDPDGNPLPPRDEWGSAAEVAKFNRCADKFAYIITDPRNYRLEIFWEIDAVIGAEYLQQLRQQVLALPEELADCPRWLDFSPTLKRGRKLLVEWMDTKGVSLVAAGAPGPVIRDAARLDGVHPIYLHALVDNGSPPVLNLGKWEPLSAPTIGYVLIVYDQASDDEVTEVVAKLPGMPLVRCWPSRLWRLLAQRAMGAANQFVLRAVDSRGPMGPGASTPGVLERPVTLPGWLK